MEMKKMDRGEMAAVYQMYMIEDFPSSELKPLEMILQSFDAGIYRAYGFYHEGKLMAYAYICGTAGKPEAPLLLDYLAVIKEHRDQGVGSVVLATLRKGIPQGLLIEAESVKTAQTPEELQTRERRIRFYECNGAIRQAFETTTFGVRFTIFSLGGPKDMDARQSLKEIYSDMLRGRYSLDDVFKYHD